MPAEPERIVQGDTHLYFTRLVAGPLDYTPGVFDILISSTDGTPRPPRPYTPREEERVAARLRALGYLE